LFLFLRISLSWQALERKRANNTEKENKNIPAITEQEPEVYSRHEWWDFRLGWKSTLNNLRLIIQPYVFFNLLHPWLDIFNIPALENGFLLLRNMMNQFDGYVRFDSG
jgi:hypothetical protein